MSRARALTIKYWGVFPIALAAALIGLRALVATPQLARLAPVPSDTRDPPGTRAYAGSLDIARGGPVIVGFQSSGLGRLTVAGHEIAGRTLAKDRIVLAAGPVAIRVAAPDARLIWSPVGRRGDPEYVPANSLSPDPPERASFGAFAGAAPLDGAIAAALLAILVASLCVLARRRLRAVPRQTWIAMAAIFVAACVVRWIDLSGFGQTWDEDVNWASGRNYITNILALDLRTESWQWNLEHPPVMKYLAGIGAQFADGYGPARAISGICSALACALLVPIGARLYRLRVGVLAGAIAALLPPLVAHGQIVGHEAPSVLWWTLAIVLALGVHDDLPDEVHLARTRIRTRLAWLGVAVGVALSSRFINGLCGPLVVAIAVIYARPGWRRQTLRDGLVLVPALAIVTLYVIWPRMWGHPFLALHDSFAKLAHTHSPEPFLGEITASPPPYYFLPYLAATLPLGVLAGFVAWCVRAARVRDRSALVVLAWLVVPLGVAASPVRQDGVRYVLPTVAALAFAAAAGWEWLATRFERRWRHAFGALAGALGLYLALVLVHIHPYYLDYFAEQVGGAGTVADHRWFETAWWGEGVDRAVDYVNANAAPNAHVYRDCIEPYHLAWFRADLWDLAKTPASADWIIAYAPASHSCPIPRDAHRVYVLEADGAILVEVWKREPVSGKP
ncbi:MAG TPA: glycosyltransferase family 39 protein [Kofleriaceae bacterium]|nr:glycosyltransferase family 39 protein [Kofleriaceae bacterium]